MMEAEVGVRRLQAKGHQGCLETPQCLEGGRERIPPHSSASAPVLDLWAPQLYENVFLLL